MIKLILCIYFVFLFGLFVEVDNKIVSVSLTRQKTPRENAINTENIEPIGIWLDWLKTSNLEKPGKRNSTNSTISLHRFLDSEYYGTIFVGSKNKSFNVIFDTAWSTTWLMSTSCPSTSPGCWFHNKYDHDRSATYKPDGAKYFVNEGSYNLSGYYSIDRFNFAGVKVKDQRFVEMDNVPYLYMFSKADGVVGMSLPYAGQNNFVMELYKTGQIKKPIFTIYLNRNRASNQGGSILLGAINKKHIHVTNKTYDTITYVQVDSSSGLWQFKMDAVAFTNKNKTIPICITNCEAIVDTGSNNIIASKEEIAKINFIIKAKPFHFGRFEVDCDKVNQLMHFAFIFGGRNFTLTGKDYIQKISYGSVTVCLSAFIEATTPSEANVWVLGGAFLARYYSIYDMAQRTIGFVRAA